MQKRLLSIVLALILTVQMFPVIAMADDSNTTTSLETGIGTGSPELSVAALWDGTTETEPEKDESGVYQIGTAAELAWFRTHVNNTAACDSNAVLTADIDLSNQNWVPISTQSSVTDKYKGTFNGQFHTISGLSVKGTTAYQGLFADINGATIQNLMVEGSVSGSSNYVGGIVGSTRNATIENCSFSGSVTYTGSASHYIGGIIGGNQTKESTISGCVNMADVTGYTAGGIMGYSTQKNTIENCYNTGTITGSFRSGGIAGQVSTGTITNCYNIGEITGASSTPGGIYSFSSAKITNCYHLYPQTEAPGGSPIGNSVKIEGPEGLLTRLNSDAFVDDDGANGGYPLLSWQTPPDTSSYISLSGDTTIYVQTEAGSNETTLSIGLKNIDAGDIHHVAWTVEASKGSANAQDIVSWQIADNDETHLIVSAKKGGIVTVTVAAEVNGETLTATRTVSVIPQITTVEIVNVNDPGAVAMGQTVQVKVFTLGGEEYDYDNDPPLTYEWRYNSTSSSANIPGETARTFYIPTTSDYSEWKDLYVEIKSGGVVVKEAQDVRGQLRSEDYGKLYPVAYDPDFTLPDKVKENNPLVLPAAHTVDGVTANITWSSDNAAINAVTGAVARPVGGKVDVTLTARCEYGKAFADKTFKLTVYSEEAAENESNKSYLQEAADSLGKWYGPIAPVYGKDKNIAAMLKADLSAKGYDDLSIEIKSITEIYDGAGVAPNGDVTYFYTDPNASRALWFGQYKVTFTLSKGSDNLDVKDLTVNLYWDKSKVEKVIRGEILSGVTERSILAENNDRDNVVSNLVLPKVVDDKKWTQIEWTSSDPSTLFVSNENQGTADTLFNPYVGRVIRGEKDKEVTLTAKFIFQRTATGEPEIVLYKTFTFTIGALTGAEVDAIRAELFKKLDTGFHAVGLRDYVTGENLTEADGIYSTINDIQLPTTRDFGVDGKYFPVTVTSSDSDTIVAPDVANAARVTVYRPPVDASAKTVTLTVSMTDSARGISASKKFAIEVLPLVQAEIDDALALMDQAKTAYFDGLNEGRYADEFSIAGGLHPFQKAVWNDSKSGLRWIYDSRKTTQSGIVADELDNWAEQEAWRAFRSSDMTILDHETLNHVAQPAEDTFVRINSMLTHEVYGKYAGRPGYEGFERLYKQPVAVYVMVEGKNHPSRALEELEHMRDEAISRISAPISAQFTLFGTKPQAKMRAMSAASISSGNALIQTTVDKLEAGTTVFGLFRKVLAQQGYTYKAVGSYVKSVTDADGNTLSERDGGPNSGWIYTVNGKMPSIYMNGYSLKENDVVVVRFTNDYTKEDDFGNNGSGNTGGGSGNTGGGSGSTGGGNGSTGGGNGSTIGGSGSTGGRKESGNDADGKNSGGNSEANIKTPQNGDSDSNKGIDDVLKKLAEERIKTIEGLSKTLTQEERQKALDEIDHIYSDAVEKIKAAGTNETRTAAYNKAVADFTSLLLKVGVDISSTTSKTDANTEKPFILLSAVLALTAIFGAVPVWLRKKEDKDNRKHRRNRIIATAVTAAAVLIFLLTTGWHGIAFANWWTIPVAVATVSSFLIVLRHE